MKASNGFELNIAQILCLVSVMENTYEVDPKLSDGFELKPAYFKSFYDLVY